MKNNGNVAFFFLNLEFFFPYFLMFIMVGFDPHIIVRHLKTPRHLSIDECFLLSAVLHVQLFLNTAQRLQSDTLNARVK